MFHDHVDDHLQAISLYGLNGPIAPGATSKAADTGGSS